MIDMEEVPSYARLIGTREGLEAMSAREIDDFYGALADAFGGKEEAEYGHPEEWWEDALARRSYTADFETTADLDDCRVWAAAVCEFGKPETAETGNTIEWFMEWCRLHAQCDVYFHNLAFDGAFVMDWLERNGWVWVEDRQKAADRCYTTLISDSNQVYVIELFFTPAFRVRLMDSMKVVPLSVARMAESFGLPVSKGRIDYEAPREPGHALTPEEEDYLKKDVQITCMVMQQFYEQGLRRMTAGSNALSDYRSSMGGSKGFRRWFPLLEPEEDEFIRKAYRGGWAYVNPAYQGVRVGEGCVFDVNSLYPSVMYGSCGERMPYGKPIRFEGRPKPNEAFDLWVAQVTCSFRIREGRLPCIQLKGNFRFGQTEYLAKSDGEVTFTVTNVDWELIQEQYHVYDLRWHGGYLFRSADYLFRKYVDKWMEVKEKAAIEGNKGLRQIAKYQMVNLYGKFATRIEVRSRRPVLVDDVLRYVDLEPQTRDPVYLPVGVFTTSWGRAKTVRAAQANVERFCYADTDSVHLVGTEVPEGLEVDDVALGKWKRETDFWQAKYLRAKCYIEYEVGSDDPTVHVAGMPSTCHKEVTIDNFEFGAAYGGKLYTRRVHGGIVLVPDTMQIRK